MVVAVASPLGLLAVACGGSDGAGADGGPETADVPGGTDWQTGLGGAGAGTTAPPASGRTCESGAEARVLPESDVEFCLAAPSACTSADAGCALVVTFNVNGAYLDKTELGGAPAIVVELYGPSDGTDVKDQFAELPRTLLREFPGLREDRVFAIGFSAGAGAMTRGLCHFSKKSDESPYGSTSDVYAAVVALGGCGCANDYPQLSGNFHTFTFNGMEDQFAQGDSCASGLAERAAINGCDNLSPSWEPVSPSDPYAQNADGSSNAERLHFGSCQHGEVVGYRGKDEGHVLSFKEHFDPKIEGIETAWRFIADKTK